MYDQMICIHLMYTLLCLIDVARRLLFHSLFAELRRLMRAFCTLRRLLGTKNSLTKISSFQYTKCILLLLMVRDKLALVTLAHQLAVAYSLGGLVIQSGSASVSLCTPRQLLGTFVHHDAYYTFVNLPS